MNAADWAALASDAESVQNALATLKWWMRGVVVGTSSSSQAAVADSVMRIVERAESVSNVVAVTIAQERDGAAAAEGPKGGGKS